LALNLKQSILSIDPPLNFAVPLIIIGQPHFQAIVVQVTEVYFATVIIVAGLSDLTNLTL